MTDTLRILYLAVMGLWLAALLGAAAAIVVLMRQGRDAAWPKVRIVAPLVDLVGTWAGAAAALVLILGRRDYGLAWACALGLVAFMVTAALYDRAVLLPSLDAAARRVGHGDDAARWEDNWRFLWRMSGWGRALTIAAGAGAWSAIAAW